MVEIRIVADPAVISIGELKQVLDEADTGATFSVTRDNSDDPTRSISIPVLTAIAGPVGAVLAAVVKALADVIGGQTDRKIVLQGKDGARVEVPADTSPERLRELIFQARLLDAEQVRIGLF